MFPSFQTLSRIKQFFGRNNIQLISIIILLVLGSFYYYVAGLVREGRIAEEQKQAEINQFQKQQLHEIEQIAKSIEQSNIVALQRLQSIEQTSIQVEKDLRIRDAEHDALMQRLHDIEKRLRESRP